MSEFPTSFARRCNKVTLELPVAIRPNSMNTLSNVTPSFFDQGGAHPVKFKRLFFSMTIMHAVINHREKFRSFGWTQPYSFSPNDVSISFHMLQEICNTLESHKKFPIELL